MAGVARSSGALAGLREAAEHEDLALLPVAADVTVPAEVEAAIEVVAAELGPVTFAVTCAGTAEVIGPAWEADPESWWRAVGVDLRGTMLTARSVLGRMLGRGAGRLVTVYGNLGDRQSSNVSAFAVAKAGIARLTEILAHEVDGTGVRVFGVHPGFVRTPMTERLAYSADGRTWLPRFGVGVEERWGGSQPAADLLEAIALGAADQLSGRILHVEDDLEELAERCRTDPDLRRLRLDLSGAPATQPPRPSAPAPTPRAPTPRSGQPGSGPGREPRRR